MSIAKWTLIFCFGRKPAFPERRLKLGVAPTPISTAALRYDRLTSIRAVAQTAQMRKYRPFVLGVVKGAAHDKRERRRTKRQRNVIALAGALAFRGILTTTCAMRRRPRPSGCSMRARRWSALDGGDGGKDHRSPGWPRGFEQGLKSRQRLTRRPRYDGGGTDVIRLSALLVFVRNFSS